MNMSLALRMRETNYQPTCRVHSYQNRESIYTPEFEERLISLFTFQTGSIIIKTLDSDKTEECAWSLQQRLQMQSCQTEYNCSASLFFNSYLFEYKVPAFQVIPCNDRPSEDCKTDFGSIWISRLVASSHCKQARERSLALLGRLGEKQCALSWAATQACSIVLKKLCAVMHGESTTCSPTPSYCTF